MALKTRPRTSAEREADTLTVGETVKVVFGSSVLDGTIAVATLHDYRDEAFPNLPVWTFYGVQTRYNLHERINRFDVYRVTPAERAELLDRLRADLDSIQGEINALIDAEPASGE